MTSRLTLDPPDSINRLVKWQGRSFAGMKVLDNDHATIFKCQEHKQADWNLISCHLGTMNPFNY